MPRLELVEERNIRPGRVVGGQVFGGISALADDGKGGLWALSDAHGEHEPARMFRLRDLDPVEVVLLQGAPEGARFDPEGLARLPDGRLFLSTEGEAREPRIKPALYQVLDGRLTPGPAVPEAFWPEPEHGPQVRGVRHNLGFEGLTATPDGGLWLANEQALVQDGTTTSFAAGTLVRLVRYGPDGRCRAQYRYRTDAMHPDPRPGEVESFDRGVSALAALDARRLLVLERGSVAIGGVYDNQVGIFMVVLPEASGESCEEPGDELDKELVLDLASIVPLLDPTYGDLDNFEAMVVTDGGQSLTLASDDNFRDDQRTALLRFRVDPARD
ncbi:MAG: esterase-like activity of phytase family protein [Myxococcales bacterium]|nr:esterase-like activity of phytase family protein [Myxococcales bacterium]